MNREDIWLTPIGELLDLFECHRQFLGISKPNTNPNNNNNNGTKQKREVFIDDVIPMNC
jgi:hypothetical protein